MRRFRAGRRRGTPEDPPGGGRGGGTPAVRDGRALLRRTWDDVQAREERMVAGLSDAERGAFREYLNRARTALAGRPAH